MKRPPHPENSTSEPARDPQKNSAGDHPGDHPASARRLHIDADSPFCEAAEVFAASDRAQLSALSVSAELFFNETVENLNLINPNPGHPVVYATIAETVRRFQGASRGTGEASPKKSKANRRRKPSFPRFKLDQTFYGWVHALSQAEDIAEFTTILGTTTARAYIQITSAMTLVHGLPKFFARCLAGEFTIEHANATAYACRDVKFENLPLIDDYLADRRPDITVETFKKSLGMKIAVIEPLEERIEEASKRRRVDITTVSDGTAYLTLTGPAPELQACYIRIAAFARAIRSGNIAAFNEQMEPGSTVDDDRGIAALMFDIITRTCPQLSIQVTSNNTSTGETSTQDIPLDLPDYASPTPADVTNAVNEGLSTAADDEEVADGAEASRSEVVLTMPTHGQWLESQAKMVTTVPFLTLAGNGNLPGVFSDGSPIPAETARRIAGHSKSWTRILTDPATGTPVDAKAMTYQIPANVRQTLVAQWQSCTIPGCTRRAEITEIDHIIPFDHEHPDKGGLTRFGNLHPLCKMHHQAKTDRKYSVRMPRTGVLEYVFRHGITTEVVPGDHPINAAHAKLFDDICPDGAKAQGPPKWPDPPAREPQSQGQTQNHPQDQPQDQPTQGDTRRSEECPGPAATAGQPGWVKGKPLFGPSVADNEWIWDSGEPPPF